MGSYILYREKLSGVDLFVPVQEIVPQQRTDHWEDLGKCNTLGPTYETGVPARRNKETSNTKKMSKGIGGNEEVNKTGFKVAAT